MSEILKGRADTLPPEGPVWKNKNVWLVFGFPAAILAVLAATGGAIWYASTN